MTEVRISNIDEESLIQQAKHDPAAFEQLYLQYVEDIYLYIYRRVGDRAKAEDITATTFETALRKLKQYNPQGSGFSAWLYTIARNKVVDHFRRQKFTTPLKPLVDRSPSPEDAALTSDRQRQIRQALLTLSQSDQDIITLRLYEELPSQQVAEILGITNQNVYLRLHRALNRLRAALDALENPTGADNEA